MLRINGIETPVGADIDYIKKSAAKCIGVKKTDFKHFELLRESVDSRRKSHIKMVYSVLVGLGTDEEKIVLNFSSGLVEPATRYEYILPDNKRTSRFRPYVVGFGPAGMFCALMLAKAGLKPIVLERGSDVDSRKKDVDVFWKDRKINTSSNVQFGEGGAGTFSDGKLNTGIKEKRCIEVLRTFNKNGAPNEILYSARPHIGTDLLRETVKNIRKEIISLGGEIRFNTKFLGYISANGFVHGVRFSNANGSIFEEETDCIILALGHSSRDTVSSLLSSGIKMTRKPFSVGLRIEHPRELINKAQYGTMWNNKALGAADYKLSNHPLHGRGAYTFCMCPGGTVVNAASEENGVVVNGMSNYSRDAENSNSAILVGIDPEYFAENDDVLAGIRFQQKLEQKAFIAGGSDYSAPAQLLGDFLSGFPSKSAKGVKPSCPTGVKFTDIKQLFPSFVTDEIATAIVEWDKKIHGFCLPDAVLTAPESRSSSPIRITRDEFYQTNIRGLYPCGEGAGYAGGIVSSAADGIKCAEAVLSDLT